MASLRAIARRVASGRPLDTSFPLATTYAQLLQLVEDGNFRQFKRAIDHGFDVNSHDKWGFTLLHRSCVCRNHAVVALLLERGSNTEAIATDLWTPLHLASISGAMGCPTLLVAGGANRNARDKNGKTPLHLAAYIGHVEIVRELVQLGLSKTATDNSGHAPLDQAGDRNKDEVARLLA